MFNSDNEIRSLSLPIYEARVVSLDDRDEEGKIQVRVLPQFKDVDESLLPWASPLIGTGMNPSEFSFLPPEKNSLVWVIFTDDFWKSPYWIPGYFITGFFDYSKVKNFLDNVPDLSDTEYPNIRFELLPKGNIRFYNASNGEMGTIHNSGAYTIFDSDGNVIVKTSGEIRLNGSNDYAVKYNELKSAFDQLKNDFNAFITTYNTHVHPAPGGTTSPTTSLGSSSTADMSNAQVDSVRLP